MDNDSTTDVAADKSHLTPADADHFEKLIEQVWYAVLQTDSPILLTVHKELKDLHAKMAGGEE
jgi:hypothetical protein